MARLVNGFVGMALAAATSLPARAAQAQDELPPGWLEGQVNEAGQHCRLGGAEQLEKLLLLACGSAGVWEVTLAEEAPRFVRSYAFDGEAVGFFAEADGRVWVKLQSLTARPLAAGSQLGGARFPEVAPPPTASSSPPRVTTAPAPPTPAPAAPRALVGKVQAARPGEALISLGSADGVLRGDRVELVVPARGGDDDLVVVGVVTSVTEHSAKVRLGLNEEAPFGALARVAPAQLTASLAAPPRASSLWAVELMTRPFAAMGELGGGALLSASIGRRFARSWHVVAVLDPFAIADVQDRPAVSAASFALMGSYDSQYFEMGVGVGAQTVNDTSFTVPAGSGWAVAQYLRLGAADGLNISARTSVVLFHRQFDFGGIVVAGQIPVSRGFWMLLGGGGGDVGYGYGELGLRVLMAGNGSRGSKYLTVSAGGAAVFESAQCSDLGCFPLDYGGPMAGIGGEWRF